MKYTIGTTVMGKWKIIDELGEGANARVFQVSKVEYGVEVLSALKVIRIPRASSDVKEALSEGMNEDSVKAYFQEIVNDLVREVAVMARLKSHPHIVGYEDHEVIPHEGGIGWDILIRMEQLTPLSDKLVKTSLSEADVIDLGIQLTEALAYCQEQGIIHRDIKPQNIFVNEFGQYKLGDFGVARTLDQTRSGLSRSGTEGYMAPEVYLNRPYGVTVDVYSLGLVLYSLMNGNRLPFLPPAPKRIGYTEKVQALERRIKGEPLSPPANASEAFAGVILRACAFDSGDRYRTAREMQEALRRVKRDRYPGEEEIHGERKQTGVKIPRTETRWQDTEEKTASMEDEPTRSVWSQKPPAQKAEKIKKSGKFRWGWIAGGACACVILVGLMCWAGSSSRKGWLERGTNTYYYMDGRKAKGLVTIDGSEYYFDQKGVMQTGEVTDGKNTYYLDTDGSLLYANVTETDIKTIRSEEPVSIDKRDIYARVLEQPMENVISLQVEVTVTEVKKGEPNGERRVYVRTLDGQWLLVGTLSMSEQYGQAEIVLDSPISFDALVCPEVASDFSGSISQKLTKVVCRDNTLGQCKNGHTWKAETCTDPYFCDVCQIRGEGSTGHQWTKREHVENKICSVCGEVKPFVLLASAAYGAWTTGTEAPVCESAENQVLVTWDIIGQYGAGEVTLRDGKGERISAENFIWEWSGDHLTISPTESLRTGHYIIDLEWEEYDYQFGVIYGDEDQWYLASEDVSFSGEAHWRHVSSGTFLYVENGQLTVGHDMIKVDVDELEIILDGDCLLVSLEGKEENRFVCDAYVSTKENRYLLKYQGRYLAADAHGSALYLSDTLTEECWWH